jgi:uncharacterized BrkB/YihY/UPF0761 family membrane protein
MRTRTLKWLAVVIYAVAMLLAILIIPAFAISGKVVDDELMKVFSQLVQCHALTLTIYTLFLILFGIGIRVTLKKVPKTITGGWIIFWKIAEFLFGSGVTTENNVDVNYIKQKLTKQYHTVSIQ